MDVNEILDQFADDPTVRLLLAVIALDVLLGVSAALKDRSFRLSYLGDFLRNDVLGKAVPYLALWGVLHVSGADFSVLGLDAIEETVGAIAIAAVGGSVLNSLRDLGLWKSAPEAIAGSDPVAQPVPITLDSLVEAVAPAVGATPDAEPPTSG